MDLLISELTQLGNRLLMFWTEGFRIGFDSADSSCPGGLQDFDCRRTVERKLSDFIQPGTGLIPTPNPCHPIQSFPEFLGCRWRIGSQRPNDSVGFIRIEC